MHIPTFLNDCNKAIQTFSSRLTQVRKEAASIENIVNSIKDAVLVDPNMFKGRVYHVGTFYEKIDEYRSQKIMKLVEKYKSIGSILLKIESLVAGTGTTCHFCCVEQYPLHSAFIFLSKLI